MIVDLQQFLALIIVNVSHYWYLMINVIEWINDHSDQVYTQQTVLTEVIILW